MVLRRLVTGRSLNVIVTMLDGESKPRSVQGAATARLVRDDGTVLDTARACPAGVAPGQVLLPITATDTDRLDLITATVTDGGGSESVRLEICGGHTFTVEWAKREAGELASIPDERIVAARLLSERAIEDECEQAFVRRYRRDHPLSIGPHLARLSMGQLRSLRSVSIDGSLLTSTELANVKFAAHGLVAHDGSWVGKTVEIAYEHGPDVPPGDAPRAHLLLAKHFLIPSVAGDRALRYIDAADNETVFSAPGIRDIVFSIPEVQGFVNRYQSRRVLVA